MIPPRNDKVRPFVSIEGHVYVVVGWDEHQPALGVDSLILRPLSVAERATYDDLVQTAEVESFSKTEARLVFGQHEEA